MPNIILCGEAWGAEEERQRRPFVGPSGYCLDKMLEEAGIARHRCLLTNVFNLQPRPTNDIENLCGPKAEGIPAMPALKGGKYVNARYADHLERLRVELAQPHNIIVALGGTAAWALLGNSAISKLRGTVAPSPYGKVLPTYHPAAILRQWELRPVTVLDLAKAKRESEFPEIRRPQRSAFIPETIPDIESFFHRYITSARRLSVDIETREDQITCIGIAPSTQECLVIPFVDIRKPEGSYWTRDEEVRAWTWVRRICAEPIPKVFQNGVYDLHFLWRRYGIAVTRAEDDTMLLHHALQPEAPKGLGFLGSVYSAEPAWKFMRHSTIKRDE